MIPILVVIVGGVVGGIVWLAERGLQWWWIVLGAVVIFVFILLNFLAYRKVARERDKLAEEMVEVAEARDKITNDLSSAKNEIARLQGMPPNEIEVSHRFIADNYIRGRIIQLMDVIAPGARPVISNRTIEDCEIRGPAMICLLGGVTLDDNRFDGDNIDELFVEVVENRIIVGAIGLKDCVFRRCRFTKIGIIGSKKQIEEAKKGFKP